MAGDDTRFGKCHICKEEKPIRYCPLCDHWFCGRCRWRFFSRGYEAVMQLVGGKEPGCCGPMEV